MERKGFIGGSDAKRILDGGWHQLWLEKMGMVEPEDLSHKFEVQLGAETERFHLDWLNKYHGFDIVRAYIESHKQHSWMKASLDGWCKTNDTFIEVKHSNGRANRDSMVDWYQPQIAHYCNVTGKDHGYLSYIAGNSAPDFFKMTPSKAYRDALLEAELAFWWYVENATPPDKLGASADGLLEKVVSEASDVRIDDMRVVDMSGNNEWAAYAGDYLAFKDKAAAFEAAKKTLKNLVEADVRIAAGHGVIVKRSKSGSLTFSETKS